MRQNEIKAIQNKKTHLIKISDIAIHSAGILAMLYIVKNAYVIQNNQICISIIDFIENLIYVVLMIYILTRGSFKGSQLVIMCILGITLIFCYLHTGYATLLSSFLIIASCQGIQYKRICIKLYRYSILGFFFVLFLYLTGISDAGIVRRGNTALGFSNANVCSYIIQSICLINQYINRERYLHSKKQYLIFPMIGVIDFLIVGSRTSTIIITLSPYVISLTNTILIKNHSHNFISSFVTKCFPIICIVITLATTLMYDTSNIIQLLNIVLSTRIFLNYYNYNKYGISILGQQTLFTSNEVLYNPVTKQYGTYNTIDSSYMCLLLQFGILGTFVWSVAHYFLIDKIIQHKQYVLFSISIIILLFGLLESSVLEISINFPLIYLLASDD